MPCSYVVAYRVAIKIEYIRIFYKVEVLVRMFYSKVVTCCIVKLVIIINFAFLILKFAITASFSFFIIIYT